VFLNDTRIKATGSTRQKGFLPNYSITIIWRSETNIKPLKDVTSHAFMPINTHPGRQETLFAELDEKLTLKTGSLQPEMGVQGTRSRIQSKHTCIKTTRHKRTEMSRQ
jgi:hypothetical protein